MPFRSSQVRVARYCLPLLPKATQLPAFPVHDATSTSRSALVCAMRCYRKIQRVLPPPLQGASARLGFADNSEMSAQHQGSNSLIQLHCMDKVHFTGVCELVLLLASRLALKGNLFLSPMTRLLLIFRSRFWFFARQAYEENPVACANTAGGSTLAVIGLSLPVHWHHRTVRLRFKHVG